jgi:MmyB-like transcription regulator ligand binding domain
VQHLLDAMSDVAACVVGRRTHVLAWNRLGAALIVDFESLPVRQRNFARLMFIDEQARALFVDWAAKARDLVAVLHADAGRHPDDPALAELVGELAQPARRAVVVSKLKVRGNCLPGTRSGFMSIPLRRVVSGWWPRRSGRRRPGTR